MAFELFIFAGGYKVAVYADGTVELWETDDEKICSNNTVVKVFFERIKTYITVCCADKIKIFD